MRALMKYLVLPSKVTEFEQRYLARLNRIALIFFYLHLPVLPAVAALANTDAVRALVFTAVLLVGPTLAYFQVRNARHLSLIFGFTAMCMGGLLVHFGQGAMQIEMHFYFFVLIALLSVFANPLAVIAAAVTVAVHHLLLFILLPSSVFNYNASYSVVGVHALFVVLESVAACFVARSFFDNVIGLERIVDARTRDLRLLLDNVGQGFVTVGADGTLSAERSASVDAWLGKHEPQRTLWSLFAPHDAAAAAWLEIGWVEVFAQEMPLELTLAQLPRELHLGDRVIQLEYKPIFADGVDGPLRELFLVMSDVTSDRERERALETQREMMEVFSRIARDRRGFVAFVADAQSTVEHLADGAELPLEQVWREVHTLKGNAAIFGLSSLSTTCHELEQRMQEAHRALTAEERVLLRVTWRSLEQRLYTLLGDSGSDRLEVGPSDVDALLQAIRSGASHATLRGLVDGWQHEPTALRLERIGNATRALAQRLSKGDVRVVTEPNDLRLPEQKWAPVWRSLVHVIRNAVDHGLETREERRAAGKPENGTIRLCTKIERQRFVIEIEDDGRGIQWDRVAARARTAGLPAETPADLMNAIFTTGFSTKEVVDEYSGRGIGFGAAKAACEQLGGTLTVESRAEQGTRISLTWPLSVLSHSEPESEPQPEPGALVDVYWS